MSKTKPYQIRCTQKVTYDQTVYLTEEEYQILEALDGQDIHSFNEATAFRIIERQLDSSQVLEAEESFEDFAIANEA